MKKGLKAIFPKSQKGIELAIVILFVCIHFLILIFFNELFPFSRFDIFSEAPKRYSVYFIQDPNGRYLSNFEFGVYRATSVMGVSQKEQYGIKRPSTLDNFGEVASETVLKQHIRHVLRKFSDLPFVYVTQQVVGPTNEMTIGLVQNRTWTIFNPLYRNQENEN